MASPPDGKTDVSLGSLPDEEKKSRFFFSPLLPLYWLQQEQQLQQSCRAGPGLALSLNLKGFVPSDCFSSSELYEVMGMERRLTHSLLAAFSAWTKVMRFPP